VDVAKGSQCEAEWGLGGLPTTSARDGRSLIQDEDEVVLEYACPFCSSPVWVRSA